MSSKSHTNINPSISKIILGILLGLILITPILFWKHYYFPFESAKLLSFLLVIELTLPFYLYTLFKQPRPLQHLKHPVVLALCAFMIIMGITSVFGVDPINSLIGSTRRPLGFFVYLHLFFFTFYLIEIFYQAPEWKNKLTNILIGTATLAAAYSLFESWLLPSFVTFEGRTGSVFGNPIFFATFLIIPIFLALKCALESSGRNRYFFASASFVMCVGVILSGTRGAFLGLLSGVLILGLSKWLKQTQDRKKTAIQLLISFTILIGILFCVRTLSPDNSKLYRLTHFANASTDSRLRYWDIAISGLKDAPLLGVGLENFYTLADKQFTTNDYAITNAWPDKPHNAAIEWLVSTGLLGFVSLFILMILLFCAAWKQDCESPVALLIACLSAYSIQLLFSFHTIGALVTFFFLIAYLFPVTVIQNDNIKINTKTVNMIAITSGLIALIGIWTIILPTHTLLYRLSQIEINSATNPSRSLLLCDKVFTQSFVWDYFAIAKKCESLINSKTQQKFSNATELPHAFEVSKLAYKLGLQRHPLRAQSWNNYTNLFLRYSDVSKVPVDVSGIEVAKQAIELAPSRFEAQLALASMYQTQNRLDEAEQIAENIFALLPDNTRAIWILATIAYERKDATKFIELVDLFTTLDPENAGSLNVAKEQLQLMNP